MRVLFAGTPECAVPSLQLLLGTSHRVVGVLTAEPAPVGRSRRMQISAVHAAVNTFKKEGLLEESVSILTPRRLNAEFRNTVMGLHPDILVCFAYGKIFGPKTLALFPRGAINIHPSLLPKWRGPSPVPFSLLSGDTCTGVSIQQMALEMDAGDILAQQKIYLDGTEYADELLHRCSHLGASMLASVLNSIENNTITPQPQDSTQASYSTMITKEMGLIQWDEPASVIERKIRAFTPWPNAYTTKNGEQVVILSASVQTNQKDTTEVAGTILCAEKKNGILVQTGAGILKIEKLQRQHKKALAWKDFLNGSASFLQGQFG